MTLETPIKHSCNIKCPVCNHSFSYDFKIDDFIKVHNKKTLQDVENTYNFETYLICKNPLCNYDIEIKGSILEYPSNIVKSIDILSIK